VIEALLHAYVYCIPGLLVHMLESECFGILRVVGGRGTPPI